MTKLVQTFGAAALLAVATIAVNTGAASAATCQYISQDSAGKSARGLVHSTVFGRATARRMDTACDRARRECNRRLEWAFRHGNAGRGARCYRLA